jgi:hypothetical protein
MNDHITVQPLPYKTRRRTFTLLFALFIIALPFLYLYATGYRFDFRKPTQLISTGGLYLAVERTGAEIYIDNELVRETRTFRKAFYAQNIDVGTHRVHVQKEGYHTWVKELPVSKHLVTEAEAFNLPVVPQVRVISEFQNATGTAVVRTPLLAASTTQPVIFSTTTPASTLVRNPEYQALITYFTATTSPAVTTKTRSSGIVPAADTVDEATSTLIANGVQLAMNGDDLYATWVGSFENMPYYYCAEDFPPYSTSTPAAPVEVEEAEPEDAFAIHPLQSLAPGAVCNPTIRMDRKGQTVHDFDLFPGSSDLVLVALDDGIYAVEIDDRSWQNVQPALLGKDLKMHIENGNLYVCDGHVIYQVLLDTELSII